MNKMFFVIGSSGSGKTTLVNSVLRQIGGKCNLKKIVSYTTRPQRDNEKNMEDFFFISHDYFEEKIAHHHFLEYETYNGFKYGIDLYDLMYAYEKYNLIKEITPSGLEKVIEYAKKHNLEDKIFIVSIFANDCEINQRLEKNRHLTEKEIDKKKQADLNAKSTSPIIIHKSIYNADNSFFINAEQELINFIEGKLFKNNQKIGDKKMIRIHPGYKKINRKDNPDGRFVHIIADSESTAGKVYYITVDSIDGKLLGCSCMQNAMFPFIKCKHQRAFIQQRLLGDNNDF